MLNFGSRSSIYTLMLEVIVYPQIKNKRPVIIFSGLPVLIATWTVPRGFPFVLLIIGFVSGCVVGSLLRDMYKYYS